MGNVVYLQKPPQIAHFLRVGHREHLLCEHIHAVGKLATKRLVFEAGNVAHQRELMSELRSTGAELVLDTSAAEQSVEGRYSGAASNAPWAFGDRALEPDDFQPQTNRTVIEPIARFAVANGFRTVLAPAHYLGGNQVDWLDVDHRSCEALRLALNREGGESISIDYPLILDNAQIKDGAFRKRITVALQSLPIDYLWVRIAGFGSDATGAGVDKIVRALHGLHEVGVPIIVDQVGGMAALALGSFGVASGFSNGLKGKDRFSASGWLAPKPTGAGGNPRRIFISGLDRRVRLDEIRAVFARSPTARSVFGCRDSSCCSGIDAMLNEPEAHRAVQQGRAIGGLSAIPESMRADRFLGTYLGDVQRDAARALRLKTVSDDFRSMAQKASKRIDRMVDTLEQTSERLGVIEFAPEATFRTNRSESPPGSRENP